MEELIEKLKVQIIEQLNLFDVAPSDIEADLPLFNGGLDLDSIDALELAVVLDRDYGIKISDTQEMKEVFYSISTLADYIAKHQAQSALA